MTRILAQEQDTIAAIATGQGGGIGMVRLSGPESLAVAGRVFFPRDRGRQVDSVERDAEGSMDAGTYLTVNRERRRGVD